MCINVSLGNCIVCKKPTDRAILINEIIKKFWNNLNLTKEYYTNGK